MQRIIPAILTSDPADLKNKLDALKKASKWVHIDIMDGKFVPDISISLFELTEASQYFNLEIHLMAENPEKYFKDCDEIQAKRVIFHIEATDDIESVLDAAGLYQFQKGLAINPDTPVSSLEPYISRIDSALLMGVIPGRQGNLFIPAVLEKIKEVKKLEHCPITGVDGGIGEDNIKDVFKSGIDYAIVGSRIVKIEDPPDALKRLEELIN
ncbi:MAG: ribulose-phosphate 3-epimerase [Candidatus Wildermuthbacteria bacterium]|nr:ribulose-phosphate 3-epimerase [Candidatus Wildermuthbacteria bacterium]